MEQRPPLHLRVVAIEKGAFQSPLTTVANFIFTSKFLLLYITNNSIKHQLFVYTQLNDQTVLFQTVQFYMSMKLNSSKYCYVSLTIQFKYQSFVYTQLNDQTFLFQAIQFSISTQFKCQTVLFDPQIGPYQVLPLRARVNLGAMATKGYSIFPKTPALH